MEKIRKKLQIVALVLLPLFLSACIGFQIIENVKNPTRYFKRAYREIKRIHRYDPDREGIPRHMHILIYENSERKIIKVSVPYWLVKGGLDLGTEIAECEDDFDFEDRYDFDWRSIKDLDLIGPGLLVDVEDEENKILIWLE